VDRQGITEIKHITGYLAFWDELRRRHPDLLIDTCAAGGRRNDLETLRRSAPLWRSDYSRDPIGSQCQTYGLSSWVPYYGTGAHEDDLYFLRSAMAPFMNMTWDMKKKHNYPLLRRFMKQWRDIAGNCLGDYYPLTSYSLEDDVWMAWQFDRPDLGEGMVQVFRRSDSPFKTAVFKLQGLDASIVYKIINMDSPDKTIEMTGEQLMKSGLKVAIEQAPQAVILVYMKKK